MNADPQDDIARRDPRKLAESALLGAGGLGGATVKVLARELLAALHREAEHAKTSDGLYAAVQMVNKRTEAAEARADALEEALREIEELCGPTERSYPATVGLICHNARAALAAHGKGET